MAPSEPGEAEGDDDMLGDAEGDAPKLRLEVGEAGAVADCVVAAPPDGDGVVAAAEAAAALDEAEAMEADGESTCAGDSEGDAP